MNYFFSKEEITARMIKHAAKIWGSKETTIEGFDPLISMLFEACSVELEKIGQEMTMSRARILDRLTDFLYPDNISIPASSIIQAKPLIPTLLMDKKQQFYIKNTGVSNKHVNHLTDEFYFSPIDSFLLFDASVKIVATELSLFTIEQEKRRIKVASSSVPCVRSGFSSLWIGLEINPAIESIKHLSFYFDWENEPFKRTYQEQLPHFKLRLASTNQPIQTSVDLPSIQDDVHVNSWIDEYHQPLARIEKKIKTIYEGNFITITESIGELWKLLNGKEGYPEELKKKFRDDSRNIPNDLVWFEWQIPPGIPTESLICAINCFPVLNRKLYTLTHRIQPISNFIPLSCNEHFLSVHKVNDEYGLEYKPISFVADQKEPNTYSLNKKEFGRFDDRNAQEQLYLVANLLRAEAKAFAVYGIGVEPIIEQISQKLAILQKKITSVGTHPNHTPYLSINTSNLGHLFVEFWAFNGHFANAIPQGTVLETDNNVLRGARLVTTTGGSEDKTDESLKVHQLKKNLLTHGRIVTQEDIKAACRAELGTKLADITVEKGFMMSQESGVGMVRCLTIDLTLYPNTVNDKDLIHTKMMSIFKSQSAMHLPYHLIIN